VMGMSLTLVLELTLLFWGQLVVRRASISKAPANPAVISMAWGRRPPRSDRPLHRAIRCRAFWSWEYSWGVNPIGTNVSTIFNSKFSSEEGTP